MSGSPGEHLNWLQTFQDLLRYYLAPVQNTPLVNVSGLIAVGLGLFLAFRCWKFERFVVSVCGVFLGAWLGYWVSRLIDTPAPIPAAIGVVVVTLLAYRTYRWWLATGSIVVLFAVALAFQLGQGDLKRYLPDLGDPGRPLRGDWVDRLPADAAEQGRNLRATWSDQIAKVKEPLLRELKALGPVGWLLPVGAALIGGLLAYWALRGFAVVWVGYLGANVAVLGALTFLAAHWPGVQTWAISKPQYPAGCIVGVWLLGLILQAKEIRFPKKSPPEPAAPTKGPAEA